MTTRNKLAVYILNFLLVGSGFLLTEGSKGILKGICWFLSFVFMRYYSQEIGIIWGFLVIIGSNVHLYITIKRAYSNISIIKNNQTTKSSSIIGILEGLVPFIYLGVGLFQLAAIQGGIIDWWGLHWIIALIVAFPIAYIPIVGTVVGIMGAIKSWHWSPVSAILLFCWPYVIFAIVLAGSSFSEVISSFRKA